MVLTMANGAVFFLQAGTEELVNEWVSTCNYWAARTSKEPLAGGVSNMEYGWNRVVEGYLHDHLRSETESVKQSVDYSDTMSVRSGRSTRSRFGWKDGSATVRAPHSPWADRTSISDWKPPLPPTVSSVHDEEAQLEALKKHVAALKKDLEQHNEYRQPMTALVGISLCEVLVTADGRYPSTNPGRPMRSKRRVIGKRNLNICLPKSLSTTPT
jgi:PH/SEC7 domain-containing protein